MKNNIFYAIAALTLLAPVATQAQRVQPIPDEVSEIRIEGHQNLLIVSGDENRIETNGDKSGIARVRNGRMTFSDADDITIRLAPSRSMVFRAEDYATMVFDGSFAIRDNLTVETEDYARATFAGDTIDTVRAANLVLRADDFSRITSDVILKHYNYELASSDFSRIVLAGMDLMESSEANNWGELLLSTHINDKGKVYRGRMTSGGVVLRTDYPEDDDFTSRVEVNATDRAVILARDFASGKEDKTKKKNTWDSGDFFLRFAWGWHNWGSQPFSGFGGVQGPAELTTTMNNLQLEGNIAIVENRWFSVSAGLGLEWNSFKFAEGEMLWDVTAEPYHLAVGADPNCLSRLKTRYVTLPVRMHFGDRDGWHIELTALPGLAWTGKNSGLRREYGGGNGQSKVKDFSVNRSINPYKFDVRAAVMYDWIGLYVQVSTLSVFRNNCDELFPVKFGIIL